MNPPERKSRPTHCLLRPVVFVVAALALMGPRLALAQATSTAITTTFVDLGRGVPGLVYRPANPGPKAAIAVFVMHPEADYLQFTPCTELSKRGYTVLCANTSVNKPEGDTDFSIEKVVLEAKLGVAYLRKQPGIRKVVLLGHSGGGTLMSTYQDVAENGVKICQTPEKISKCPDSLAGLPPADGIMLLDSNFGLGAMMLLSLDPAVTDDSGLHLDPALNLFNPANGYESKGGSHYSDAFIRRWQTAVGQRNNRVIGQAQAGLAAIEQGRGRFDDDDSFVVPGATYGQFDNKLFLQDTKLLSHTKKAWPLLHKGGVVTIGIVPSVRVADPGDSTATATFTDGALKTTLRHFLSSFAVRTTPDFSYGADGITGVDWSSSYAMPASSVRGIHVPLLAMGMTGHYEYLAAELIYDNAASRDKTIAFVEGASHLFTTCTECEKTPGEYGDTVKTTFDYVDRWLSKPGRF